MSEKFFQTKRYDKNTGYRYLNSFIFRRISEGEIYEVVSHDAFTLCRQEPHAAREHVFTLEEVNKFCPDNPVTEQEIGWRMKSLMAKHPNRYSGKEDGKTLCPDAERDMAHDRALAEHLHVDTTPPQTGNNKAMRYKENELVGVRYKFRDDVMIQAIDAVKL